MKAGRRSRGGRAEPAWAGPGTGSAKPARAVRAVAPSPSSGAFCCLSSIGAARLGPSETSLVKALNADPSVRRSGDPDDPMAGTSTVASESHRNNALAQLRGASLIAFPVQRGAGTPGKLTTEPA